MTYSSPFLRVSVSGKHYADEQWSWGFSIDGAPRPDTVPAGVVSAIQAFFNSGFISAQAVLTTIKVNEIGTNGLYTQPVTVAHDFVPTTTGGGSLTNTEAPQVALAVTLRSDRRRGAGAFGRFYLPLPKVTFDPATGLVAEAECQTIADAAGTMLNGVADALGGAVVIASQGGKDRPPANVLVTSVAVGRVLDTQRRRRSALKESHVDSSTYTPAGGFTGGGDF